MVAFFSGQRSAEPEPREVINPAAVADCNTDEEKLTISSSVPLANLYFKKGYESKDHCIINAIRAIQRNPTSGFYYSVKVDRTLYSGAHVFIVYFNFKINGVSYQISFHTFSNMWRFVNKKCVTRWKKKYSSKEATIKLAYYVFGD